jgi:hypothetical protein
VSRAHPGAGRGPDLRGQLPAVFVSIAVLGWLLPASTLPASAFAGRLPRTDDPIHRAKWIIQENLLPGTTDWMIPAGTRQGIEGFADRVSAVRGQRVGLHVSTGAPTFHVEAYRIGYYGGLGGRLVWRSREIAGARGADPLLLDATNTIEAPWPESVGFEVTSAWVQGEYLLKLVSSSGGQG